MEKSLFAQWVDKWFGPLARKVVETINGTKNPLTYLHLSMLRPEFSTTLKWGTLSSNNTMVSADVVAMDSSLPLKERDSIKKYEGDIPKLGMKLYLNEKTMSDIGILQRTTGQENEVVRKLFADTKKVTVGIYEMLEFMFLQSLSSGVTSITNEKNPGLGIRIDFGHPASNKFGAVTKWSDPNSKPLDDIERITTVARAKGDLLPYIYMDRTTFNSFKKNAQVREMFAFSLGFTGTNVPIPSLQQVNDFLTSNYGITITIIERTVTFEKNGERTVKTPWAENAVVFLPTTQVGTLTYGRLAEEDHPAKQVDYQKVANYILLSKYHKNDPIREFTSSQALVLPVIDNMESIYILDAEEAVIDAQTEGDANFDYKEESYTKASVLAGIKAAKPTSKLLITSTDAKMLETINEFSEEQIALFEAKLVASA